MRIRTLWQGTETSFMRFWRELIDLGHQRFKLENTGESNSFWADLFLPELLKYGVPKDDIDLSKSAFFWPWPDGKPLLRPIFKGHRQLVMYLDVNYYGIFYDSSLSVFRACMPRSGNVNLLYNDRLRHTRILREAGIPFDVFQDNQKIWPIIDFDRPNDRYEYYFQKTSEV